jgi:hypothetical protein
MTITNILRPIPLKQHNLFFPGVERFSYHCLVIYIIYNKNISNSIRNLGL